MSEKLTARQEQVLDFIRTSTARNGSCPTIREIGDHFDIVSPTGVAYHLKALETKGYITRKEGVSRSIRLTSAAKPPEGLAWVDLEDVPELGCDGFVPDRIDINAMYDPSDTDLFVIQITDNRLASANIQKGDFVAFTKSGTAKKGQVIVAMLDGQPVLRIWSPDRGRGTGGTLELPGTRVKPVKVVKPVILAVASGLCREL